MKAHTHGGNRRRVVVDHHEAEADGQKQARKVLEVKGASAARCGEGAFHAVPDDEDGCEGPEQILTHGVEEAEVLGEERANGLEDVLEIVGLHGRQLLALMGQTPSPTACGRIPENWSGWLRPRPCWRRCPLGVRYRH